MLFVTGLTSWIFNSEDLGGFTWVSDTSLILSADLELNLCSFNDICDSVLTVWTRGLCAFHPAGSKLFLLFNAIPTV